MLIHPEDIRHTLKSVRFVLTNEWLHINEPLFGLNAEFTITYGDEVFKVKANPNLRIFGFADYTARHCAENRLSDLIQRYPTLRYHLMELIART